MKIMGVEMQKRIAVFLILSFIVTGCSQEHLIFLKNLRNIKLLTLQDILEESGLSNKKNREERITNQTGNETVNENIVKNNVESFNKELVLPSDKDFSIGIKLSNDFVVLKSIQGDAVYIKDSSRQEKGLFLFHSGRKDSKIRFQDFDINGTLIKNLNYFVKIQSVPEETRKPVKTVFSSSSSSNLTETNAVVSSSGNTDISSAIIASIQGLSTTEALHELSKILASPDIQDDEKEVIRYKMTEILISQKSYGQAETQINNMQNQYKKSYYTGKLLMDRKNFKEALRHYLNALGGDDDTRKNSVLDLEKLILSIGAAEKSLIDRLKVETGKYKSDKSFYVASMLGIAKIYQSLPDIYSAKDIYESILNGDYSQDQKDKAKNSYEELKKDFLEYH